MEQRTDEWFEARKKRITASAVGGILGLSPHMTRDDVMRNMAREALGAEREFQGNVATRWGALNEDGALIDFRFKTGLDVEQIGFCFYEDWAGCSPDGLVGQDAGLEIKCPYGLRASDAEVQFKTLAEQPHYEAQVQFSMFVTGRSTWHFFQWSPTDTALETVSADPAWVDQNIPVLRQFYAEFLWELENNAERHLAPKRPVIDTPEAQQMLAEWDEITAQLEELTKRKKDLLDKIVDLCGHNNAEIAGRKITKVEREGAVAYAKVVKDHCKGVDLEPYRSKATSYWKVS